MKKFISFAMFVSTFLFCIFLPRSDADSQPAFPEPEVFISMDFQNANLKDVLKVFSIQAGLNFIASEGLQDRTLTLYLDKVPLDMAMNELFKANNLSYELNEEANIFVVKDWGKPGVETITKVFYLKYNSVPSSLISAEKAPEQEISSSSGTSSGSGSTTSEGGDIVKVITSLLSNSGKISEDAKTNSLIVTDIPSNMSRIEKVISQLDVPAPQVLIEVEMLDVSKNKVDRIGFDWSQAGSYALSITGAQKNTNFPFDHSSPGNITPGVMSFSNLILALDFLRTQTDTKYLARPRILTLNNETAVIKITTNEAVAEILTSSGGVDPISATGFERVETGVSLRVTPQINTDTGEITMFIVPSVKDTSVSSLFSSTAKDPEERSTTSKVRIKDGETVVIGGLIRNEYLTQETKIPILGDIPLLGALFRHKGQTRAGNVPDKAKERELLVFITPHIIKDNKTTQLAKGGNVLLSEREQNIFSANSRDSVINSSLKNYENTK